jgi:alginate O-acetyltransferase complex protein AlgI
LQHVYALAVIMVGWVFFRAESLGAAIHYLKAMLGFTHGSASLPFAVMTPVEPYLWFIFGIAVLFAMPLLPIINRYRAGEGLASRRVAIVLAVLQDVVILGLLVVAIIFLSSTTHQAYIYMRF